MTAKIVCFLSRISINIASPLRTVLFPRGAHRRTFPVVLGSRWPDTADSYPGAADSNPPAADARPVFSYGGLCGSTCSLVSISALSMRLSGIAPRSINRLVRALRSCSFCRCRSSLTRFSLCRASSRTISIYCSRVFLSAMSILSFSIWNAQERPTVLSVSHSRVCPVILLSNRSSGLGLTLLPRLLR